MKVIVLVKQVPDTGGDRCIDGGSKTVDRVDSDQVLDEVNGRALEVALRHKDAVGCEVVALTMGPAQAAAVLRQSLAMGADSAVHIIDDRLVGADAMLTSAVLTAALRRLEPDLVVTGNESTDGRGGVVPALIAERLGFAAATFVHDVVIGSATVTGTRSGDSVTVVLRADLPALVSVTEASSEARRPTLRGVMQAKKKPTQTWSLAGLDLAEQKARSLVSSVDRRPARRAGVILVDDGTAATQLVAYLAAERLL